MNSIVFYPVRSGSKMFDPIPPHSPEFWLGLTIRAYVALNGMGAPMAPVRARTPPTLTLRPHCKPYRTR